MLWWDEKWWIHSFVTNCHSSSSSTSQLGKFWMSGNQSRTKSNQDQIELVYFELSECIITRLNLVNTWFSQNTFFIVFFTGTAFILVNYIIKLVLEYQFNLQNPRKQTKMWIFETNKNPLFNISLGMFSKNEVKNHVL